MYPIPENFQTTKMHCLCKSNNAAVILTVNTTLIQSFKLYNFEKINVDAVIQPFMIEMRIEEKVILPRKALPTAAFKRIIPEQHFLLSTKVCSRYCFTLHVEFLPLFFCRALQSFSQGGLVPIVLSYQVLVYFLALSAVHNVQELRQIFRYQ